MLVNSLEKALIFFPFFFPLRQRKEASDGGGVSERVWSAALDTKLFNRQTPEWNMHEKQ